MAWILIALLLVCSPALAGDPVWMTAFSSADEDDATNGYDSFEFLQRLDGDAEDADIRLQMTTICGAVNGCDATSLWALEVDVGQNEQAYYEPVNTTAGMCATTATDECDENSDCPGADHYGCRIAEQSPFPLDTYEMAVDGRLYLASAGSNRPILEIIESDGGTGANLVWNTDRTFTVRYDTTTLGTPTFIAHDTACTTPYTHLPCLDNSYCPSGYPCTANKYWAPVKLYQYSQSPTVNVDLYVAGHRIAHYTPIPASAPSKPATFRIGGTTDDPNGAIHFYAASMVAYACSESSCPINSAWGYVATAYADTDGDDKEWGETSGGGCLSSTHWDCLNDYSDTDEAPDYTYGSGRVTSTQKGKLEEIAGFTSVTVSGDRTVDAIDIVGFGDAGDGNAATTHQFELTGYVNSIDPAYTMSSGMITVGNASPHDDENNNDRQVVRVLGSRPSMLFDNWSTTDIDSLTISLNSSSTNTNLTRLGVVEVYVHVVEPGQLPDTIPEGNKGTDDNERTVAIVGDSTSVPDQTLQGQCDNDPSVFCTQRSHCSWDPEKDTPTGGCGSNEQCITCSGSQGATVGYRCNTADPTDADALLCHSICSGGTAPPDTNCTVDGDCSGGGTCEINDCVAGHCTRNPTVTCSSRTTCENLGTCSMTATCDDSCPGGDCPPTLSWSDYIPGNVRVDNLINCAHGGWGTWHQNEHFERVLDAEAKTCQNTGSGYFGDACDDSSDCGGTLCLPFCDVIQGERKKPDVIAVDLAVNDSAIYSNAPNCDGIGAAHGGSIAGTGACSPPTQVNCARHQDCIDQVGPDSVCAGRLPNSSSTCYSNIIQYGVSGTCSVVHRICRQGSDCYFYGMDTCTVDEPTKDYPRGNCKCVDNDDCPDPLSASDPGWVCAKVCVGGSADDKGCLVASDCPGGTCTNTEICHRGCTTDAQCYGAGACNNAGTQDWCQGTCTYPGSEQDCDDPTDCDSLNLMVTNRVFSWNGTCSSGHCLCSGPSYCYGDGACATQYETGWLNALKGHAVAIEYYDRWQSVIDGLSESDGRPKLLFSTVPDTYAAECDPSRGDKQYVARVNEHLRGDAYCSGGTDVGENCTEDSQCSGGTCNRRYRYVADCADDFDHDKATHLQPDGLHFSAPGSESLGMCMVDRLLSWNTCSLDAGTEDTIPQYYCRNANGTWPSPQVPCTVETEQTDCTGIQTCELQGCTCDCVGSVCAGTAYPGQACSIDNDCCSPFGGVCSGGICTSACYGSAECNVVS